MNSLQLYRKLCQQLTALGVPASKSQRENLALLCHSLAVSPNCHLATLALGLPIHGQRDHLIQRLRRFLKNERVFTADWYQPVVRHLLAHWRGREVNLVMDRTDLTNRLSILMVGAAYGKRVLPLAWDVLRYGSTSAQRQVALLQRIEPYLPPLEHVRVYFHGDCEFRSVALQQMARRRRWHWQVGLKSDELFHLGDGQWQPLRALTLAPGQRRYLQAVTITREHGFGPVNLIADWSTNGDSPRYWSVDQPADKQAWRRGRKRFWIEPTFRDWKSYGFDVEHTQIDDPRRLDVLLLAMVITTVWMIHIGDWLTQSGHRQWLESPHKRDYSLFRLGRDYLQRVRTVGGPVPVGFTVGPGA